ncbi:MAG: site-specific integrase, partial [Rhizobacter sp.]|nr:site-specific integrase [Rhizobacter sp.]
DESPRRSWNDTVVRGCKEQSYKTTAEEDKAKLRRFDQHLGGKELDTVNRDMIERISQAKLDDG